MKNFKLKRYKKLEEVFSIGFEIPIEELENSSLGAVMDDGEEVEISLNEELKNIKEIGYHGCIDKNNVIHFWIDNNKNISLEDLIFFFGHEIGHRTGKPIKGNHIKDKMICVKEEHRADKYGNVAKLAFKFAKTINQNPK